ncbi:MAG TPA: ATP-dependent 6-phosphofructokinase [Lacunisphaera sp.]|jgi:6-phosphofructokinase 1|nr:ATP-dependent 6-phosphofructokinase [Lacunisphaera sp.]
MKKRTVKRIGILTAGGDSPGLNAAIRAVGKAAIGELGWEVVGFHDGFLGLALDRWQRLDKSTLAGILTVGGTVLGTSREKPHRMEIDGKVRDMIPRIVATYRRHRLSALVCIGGGGTHKNALRLIKAGLNIVTLPKTIDNDVALTDATIGFDTALGIASEALDRLHSTAHSHHRIIVAEIMGHRAGWLTLGAGIGGGADVILIPEIPYDTGRIADAIGRRAKKHRNFSIVAVAEGALSREDAAAFAAAKRRKKKAETDEERDRAKAELAGLDARHAGNTMRLAAQLEDLTGLEARVTILGYVQRGGTPSVTDRLLATRLGTTCVDLINKEKFGVMVAARGDGCIPVPIGHVAGNLKLVPTDHSWVEAARRVGTCLGD